MQLSNLTDDELVRMAHTEIDSLTSTPLELELLRRFEALTGAAGQTAAAIAERSYGDREASQLLAAVGDHGFTAGDVRDLGDALVVDVATTVDLLQAIANAEYSDAVVLAADLARLSTLTATATATE